MGRLHHHVDYRLDTDDRPVPHRIRSCDDSDHRLAGINRLNTTLVSIYRKNQQ